MECCCAPQYPTRNTSYPSQPEHTIRRSCPPDPCPTGDRVHISNQGDSKVSNIRRTRTSQQNSLAGFEPIQSKTSETDQHEEDSRYQDGNSDEPMVSPTQSSDEVDEDGNDRDKASLSKRPSGQYSSTVSDEPTNEDNLLEQETNKTKSATASSRSSHIQGDAKGKVAGLKSTRNQTKEGIKEISDGETSASTLPERKTSGVSGQAPSKKGSYYTHQSKLTSITQINQSDRKTCCAGNVCGRTTKKDGTAGILPKERTKAESHHSKYSKETHVDDTLSDANSNVLENGQNCSKKGFETNTNNEVLETSQGEKDRCCAGNVVEHMSKETVVKAKRYDRAVTKDDLNRLNQIKDEIIKFKEKAAQEEEASEAEAVDHKLLEVVEKPNQKNAKVKVVKKKLLFALGIGFIISAILTILCKPSFEHFVDLNDLLAFDEVSIYAKEFGLESILLVSAIGGLFFLRRIYFGGSYIVNRALAMIKSKAKFLGSQKGPIRSRRVELPSKKISEQDAILPAEPVVCTECKATPDFNRKEQIVRTLAVQGPAGQEKKTTIWNYFSQAANMVRKESPPNAAVWPEQQKTLRDIMAARNNLRICSKCKGIIRSSSQQPVHVKSKEPWARSVAIQSPGKYNETAGYMLKRSPRSKVAEISQSIKASNYTTFREAKLNSASKTGSLSGNMKVSPASPAEDSSRTNVEAALKKPVLKRCLVKAKPVGSQTKNVKFDSPPSEAQSNTNDKFKYLKIQTR